MSKRFHSLTCGAVDKECAIKGFLQRKVGRFAGGVAAIFCIGLAATMLLAQQPSAAHADPTVAARATTESTLPPGDPANGKAVFEGKGNCLSCHRVVGQGSRLGPDLTEIGVIRSPEQLQESLTKPNAEVLPENRFFTVVTRDGMTITGRLLNQDTFHVQLMDQKERLRSFDKSQLRSYAFVKESTMPAYEGTLSSQELADVIAYLGTLKGLNAQ